MSAGTVQFTPDFVKYFHEREKSIKKYQHDLPQLKQTQQRLTDQEALLLADYEQVIQINLLVDSFLDLILVHCV